MKKWTLTRFFFLFYFLVFTVRASASNDSIREGLKKIKSHWVKNRTLDNNPLENQKFLAREARGYLLFYRALGHYLVAKNKKPAHKHPHLKKAYRDIKQAGNAPWMEKGPLLEWQKKITRELIEVCFVTKRYFSVLNLIENFPPEVQKEPQWVLYYGTALFESRQLSSLEHLIHNFPQYFKDSSLLKKHLPSPPAWKKFVAQTLEKTPPSPPPLPKGLPLAGLGGTFTPKSMLEDPKKVLEVLKNGFYFQNYSGIYQAASNLYLNLLEKNSLNSEQSRFLKAFENEMSSFAPAQIEDLITDLWRKKKLKLAESLSEDFLKEYRGHPLYPKILYDLGRIREDGHQYSAAHSAFSSVLETTDGVPYTELALFRTGWTAYLDQNYKVAAEYFERYLKHFPDGQYATTSGYLGIKLASSLKSLPPKEIEGKAEAFLKRHPLNLYSLVLLEEWQWPKEKIISQFSAIPLLKEQDEASPLFKAGINYITLLKLYRDLRDLGLNDEASRLLMGIPFDEGNDLFMFQVAREFDKIDHIHGRTHSLNKILTSFPHLRPQIPWQALFPRFKFEEIKSVLEEHNIDLSPYLVLAIIRQESAFNTQARSVANAYGLMQLIPSTAEIMGKALKLKSIDLYKERDNLKLGSANIFYLLKKFKGRMDYALSAYNAGERVTQFWISLRGHLPPMEFIESIPYQETRFYVKNVMRNYFLYQLLYEERPKPLVFYELPLTTFVSKKRP